MPKNLHYQGYDPGKHVSKLSNFQIESPQIMYLCYIGLVYLGFCL